MGIRDVLKLTKESVEHNEQFGPALVTLLVQLVQEMSELCLASSVSLAAISAFDMKTNDWQIALLQIYENLYLSECRKV
jgi:hypothetical protein